jgi:hypothetical protein
MDTNIVKHTKLVKSSDGERGLEGRTKQYVVQVILNGNEYIVRTYWGKNDWNTQSLASLQSKLIGKTTSKWYADQWVEEVIAKKMAKGYRMLAPTHG